MTLLTKEKLLSTLPRTFTATADLWLSPLNRAMEEWHINTPERQAAFLAQVLHESGELKRLEENLNYSAKRLREVWPKRFPTDEIAQRYGNQPERIANKVYGGRMGNGDEASGDGWRYRGRGLIQITGRSNYAACTRALNTNFIGNPDLLAEPLAAARSAGWFWNSRGLNALADHRPGDNDQEDFIQMSKIINGGAVGLPERLAYWGKARLVLGA